MHKAETSTSTWFLPAARASANELTAQVEFAANSPLVHALLKSLKGAVAVLNGARQLVAVNTAYLGELGGANALDILGLRPGEAFRCPHAASAPGGCGTGKACVGCGHAIAVAGATGSEKPVERDCVLPVFREGGPQEIVFRVLATAFDLGPDRGTLVSMVDVSLERRRAALERAFVHDLANLSCGLFGAVSGIDDPDPAQAESCRKDLRGLSLRLAREVEVQRALLAPRPGQLSIRVEAVSAAELLAQVSELLQNHPAVRARRLTVVTPEPSLVVHTDVGLFARVLSNMVLNALEATAGGGEVRCWAEPHDGGVAFRCANPGVIPVAVSARIFSRYFSTKGEASRGHGTFVMKLFGEQFLGGRVSFQSTPQEGTLFEAWLPLSAPSNSN